MSLRQGVEIMEIAPDEIVLRHTKDLIANSNYSQAKFVHDLLLPALLEKGLESSTDHRTADEYEYWRSAKVRQINNIINQNTNLPLRWLWVWLDVLPEPYGSRARKEFLASGGVSDISLDVPVEKVGKADLPNIFREIADVMEAGAIVAADGRYDSQDDPEQLLKLSNELTDVIEAAANELIAIDKARSLKGSRAGVVVQMVKSPSGKITK